MDHDLVVIGGGSAGLVAAQVAAAIGASVALVEREAWPGGECLWTGCVPSKALIAIANRAHAARDASRFGVHASQVAIDFGEVMRSVRAAQEAIKPHDSFEQLRAAGVRTLRGSARVLAPGRVEVDTGSSALELTCRHVLLATGSAPVMLDVPGRDRPEVMTTDDVWSLQELPSRLLVVGGGAVGCELGQAFARLGSIVTMVEPGERLLEHEEPFAAEIVTRALEADGVTVRTGTSVEAIGDGAVELCDGTSTPTDRVLVAAGRTPSIHGLVRAEVGLRLDATGHVEVDDRQRSNVRGIWAAGDVTGQLPFTNAAGVQGANAALNALLGARRRFDAERVPWVTFTDPEVGRVGITADVARTRLGARAVVSSLPFGLVDRAVTAGASAGELRLVTDRGRRLLGATVVAASGGEVVSHVARVVGERRGIAHLAGAPHPYPTLGEAAHRAAIALQRERLATPWIRTALRWTVRVVSRFT